MMRGITVTLTIGAVVAMAGCANDTLLGSNAAQPTASIVPVRPAKPVVDPACAALDVRIQAMRKDGVVDRLATASKGKGATVSVKRASLARVAELEQANAEFQANCSTLPRQAAAPSATAAPAQPPVAPQKVAAAVNAAPATVKAKAPAARKASGESPPAAPRN
jgi:hypothetical protein